MKDVIIYKGSKNSYNILGIIFLLWVEDFHNVLGYYVPYTGSICEFFNVFKTELYTFVVQLVNMVMVTKLVSVVFSQRRTRQSVKNRIFRLGYVYSHSQNINIGFT